MTWAVLPVCTTLAAIDLQISGPCRTAKRRTAAAELVTSVSGTVSPQACRSFSWRGL